MRGLTPHLEEIDRRLRGMDDDVVDAVHDLLLEPGQGSPSMAIQLIENISSFGKRDQRRFAELYRSDSKTDRSLAITMASKLPPMPPPALGCLDDVVQALTRAMKSAPAEHRDELFKASQITKRVRSRMEDEYKQLKRREGWA